MNNVKIRKAAKGDILPMKEIFNKIYENPIIEQGFLLLDISEQKLLEYVDDTYVALIENEVVGFLISSQSMPKERLEKLSINEKHSYVSDLVVSYDHSKKGIGRSLLEHVTKEGNWYSCIVTKPYNNLASFNLHKKVGFEVLSKLQEVNKIPGHDLYEVVVLRKLDGENNMNIRKVYKYGVFPSKASTLEFEFKCIEIEVKGKNKHHVDPESQRFYYAESIPGGMYEICLVNELDSNKIDEDGFLYYSKVYEDETELMDKLLKYIELGFPDEAYFLKYLKKSNKFKKEVYGDGEIDYAIGFLTYVEQMYDKGER